MEPQDGHAPPPGRIHPIVKATGAVSFFTDMANEMVYPLLPELLTGVLGVPKTIFGLIEGLAEGVPAVVRWVAGSLSDRVANRKWLILGGYATSLAAKPFIGLATGLGSAGGAGLVLGLRVLDRIGKGIRGAPRDGVVSDFAGEERGRAFGFQRAMDHAGAMAGGLIAFLLVGVLGLKLGPTILLSAIPGILAILTIILFVRDRGDRQVVARTAGAPAPGGELSREFRLYLIAAWCFALANSSDAFLLLRARELGATLAQLPLLWVVLHLVKTVTSTWGGVLSDRIGRKPLLLGGWILYGLVYLGFSTVETTWAPWALFTIYGAFFGATEGVAKAYVADLVPSEARGRAFGVLGMGEGLLLVPAGVLVGWLWDATGSGRVPLTVSALFALAAALVLLRVPESRRRAVTA